MARREATGKFVIRMPPSLHATLRRESARRGMSLNKLCVDSIRSSIERRGGVPASPTGSDAWLAKARRLWGEDLRGVVLFGSVARGEEREGSDVDLLVVIEDRLPVTRSLYTQWDAEGEADAVLNPHLVHLPADERAAGSLWLEVALDGIVLYDADGALARFLSRLRRAIASGAFESRVANGHRYWIRRLEEPGA